MQDYLRTTGWCKSSRRFVARIAKYAFMMLCLVTAIIIVCCLLQYDEFSINLFHLVEIEATR